MLGLHIMGPLGRSILKLHRWLGLGYLITLFRLEGRCQRTLFGKSILLYLYDSVCGRFLFLLIDAAYRCRGVRLEWLHGFTSMS